MAKRPVHKSSKRTPGKRFTPWGPSFGQLTGMVVFLIVLIAGIVFTMTAANQPTNPTPFAKAAKCSLDNCNQCLSNGFYIINDTYNCPAEPDGDQQYCNTTGRVGLCGGQTWCCPAPGAQWVPGSGGVCTGNSYQGSCVAPVTPTNTPIPTPTPTDTPTPTPAPTSTPYPTPTPYVYVSYDTPTPTNTPTPTPTSYILNSCNKACTVDTDCPGGLTCATAFGQKVCRNPLCADQFSCLCNQGSLGSLLLTPTPTESGLGSAQQVALTVSAFTDSNGNANSQPTITGLTEPGALVTVSIFPDGISGSVTADASGRWSWRAPKALSAGQKSLLVVAKNASGAQGQVNQTFTVVAAKAGNPWGILLLILILAGLGFGGYVYYKSNNP